MFDVDETIGDALMVVDNLDRVILVDMVLTAVVLVEDKLDVLTAVVLRKGNN